MQEGPPQEINPLLCSASPADQPSPIWPLVEMQTAVSQQSFSTLFFCVRKRRGPPRPLTYTGKRFDDCICAFCCVCIFATRFLISKCNVRSSKLVGIACKFDCAPDARQVGTFDVPKFGQIAVLQKFGRTPDKFQKF